MHTPFRYDYVGSFLRPEVLKVARIKYENNKLGLDELTKIEDEEITKLVSK